MADMLQGGQTLKFADVGDQHAFILDRIEERPDTDPSGNVKTWNDGSDKSVFVFCGRDDVEDDIQVYVRGHMFLAVKAAAKKMGYVTQEQMIGKKITIKFTGLGEQKTKGFAQPKLFAAKIEPVQGVKTSTDMLEEPEGSKGSTTEMKSTGKKQAQAAQVDEEYDPFEDS